jgi:hypothetical protein
MTVLIQMRETAALTRSEPAIDSGRRQQRAGTCSAPDGLGRAPTSGWTGTIDTKPVLGIALDVSHGGRRRHGGYALQAGQVMPIATR